MIGCFSLKEPEMDVSNLENLKSGIIRIIAVCHTEPDINIFPLAS